MKVEKKFLDRARELLEELNNLEKAKDILQNYDSKVCVQYSTFYNHNRKELKEVKIKMPPEIIGSMNEYMENRIFEIKKELETL